MARGPLWWTMLAAAGWGSHGRPGVRGRARHSESGDVPSRPHHGKTLTGRRGEAFFGLSTRESCWIGLDWGEGGRLIT